ncbi:rhodanese-like domain-containing protein [Burkholderia pseudomallei]|uniref:SIR2 family protein n=1 Tax=Burkholderia pseudomallei TaxID=28450 RepID=UPI000F08CCC0|nr:SIR2 family protein [Burkholderia pseudomallei]CAJ2765949.1 Uncharacterised protein [Burkholderia pseudomallei]VCJ20413.1 Uncharacterised protein [Burkholderia pseudomallei]
MQETISASDVYDKDLNFLFGAGASSGLFPTLALQIKNEQGAAWTLEELATRFEASDDQRYVPLFMHYYNTCIRPAQVFNVDSATGDETRERVVANYRAFLKTVLQILQRRKALERRCNLFTTNYDGCFPLIADEILREGSIDFLLNDGARGFRRRYLQARNFNTYLCQTGIFERHQASIPQINLIHVHGSVYWRKSNANIVVDYELQGTESLLDEDAQSRLAEFSACLNDSGATLENLAMPEFSEQERKDFKAAYESLPIVNPTKWKFHETVFEEHYYQMLRMLSYELEKPNAVLVTFGFSFADEHILNLVKRSLSNPHLQVYVCCYSQRSKDKLQAEFGGFRNVRCLALENASMNFTAFNEQVFSVDAGQSPQVAAVPAANAPLNPAAADPNGGAVT